jgi:hypothetical protein
MELIGQISLLWIIKNKIKESNNKPLLYVLNNVECGLMTDVSINDSFRSLYIVSSFKLW